MLLTDAQFKRFCNIHPTGEAMMVGDVPSNERLNDYPEWDPSSMNHLANTPVLFLGFRNRESIIMRDGSLCHEPILQIRDAHGKEFLLSLNRMHKSIIDSVFAEAPAIQVEIKEKKPAVVESNAGLSFTALASVAALIGVAAMKKRKVRKEIESIIPEHAKAVDDFDITVEELAEQEAES